VGCKRKCNASCAKKARDFRSRVNLYLRCQRNSSVISYVTYLIGRVQTEKKTTPAGADLNKLNAHETTLSKKLDAANKFAKANDCASHRRSPFCYRVRVMGPCNKFVDPNRKRILSLRARIAVLQSRFKNICKKKSSKTSKKSKSSSSKPAASVTDPFQRMKSFFKRFSRPTPKPAPGPATSVGNPFQGMNSFFKRFNKPKPATKPTWPGQKFTAFKKMISRPAADSSGPRPTDRFKKVFPPVKRVRNPPSTVSFMGITYQCSKILSDSTAQSISLYTSQIIKRQKRLITTTDPTKRTSLQSDIARLQNLVAQFQSARKTCRG